MPSFMCIANWKMNKSLNDAISFYQHHAQALHTLAIQHDTELVICPSFEALYALKKFYPAIALGAQDCSSSPYGPYTGQVSAQSLKEVGCSYVIIGHSERRRLYQESDTAVVQKMMNALQQNLHPIICIGEALQDHEMGRTAEVLAAQLEPLRSALAQASIPFVIAYEPAWAIGTGKTPRASELAVIFDALEKILTTINSRRAFRLIYGGSVNEKTAPELLTLKRVEGFLIGDASLDFQKLQKIVSLRS